MMRKVLNAGGGSKSIPMPSHYHGWEQVVLDIDPDCGADIVADLRDLSGLPADQFDAVYASHVLEHFYPWELPQVLEQIRHVLKPNGFLELRVPRVEAVFQAVQDGHGIHEPLYDSALGPITPYDMIYGHGDAVQQGREFMTHKTCFTLNELRATLESAQLSVELLQPTGGMQYELCAIARNVVNELAPV